MAQPCPKTPAPRRIRISALAAVLAISFGFAACDEDEAVIITYTPVAAFDAYVMTGYSNPPEEAGPGKEFVYYRVASIVNKGKDAKEYVLDYGRLTVQEDDGNNVAPMSSPLLWNGSFPADFVSHTVTVLPGQTLTFPMGADAPRFIVWQTKGTGYQRVRYSTKDAPQPVAIAMVPGAVPETKVLMDSHHLQLDLK